MYTWLVLAVIFASLETLAVSKYLQRLEYVAKPAVMACLFIWLYSTTGLQENTFWFGVGLLFSLAGDVLLMISLDRLFLFGLVAFLSTHIFYIIALKDELMDFTAWSLVLMLVILFNGVHLMRRIAGAMQAKGQSSLVGPVILYGVVISLML